MSSTNDKIAFADSGELCKAVKIFTGKDDSSKQQLISTYGEICLWDVTNVTDMTYMFAHCYNFNSDISLWDVSNVTNMIGMFYSCQNFNSDISLWNVKNVTNMQWMFHCCLNFNTDISIWNVENVTDMSFMFSDCNNFNSDFSLWNVKNVTYMDGMFHDCPKFLNSINGYKWNKQYWKFIKEIIKTRAIANYWLELSCISSYAPDGAGRKRDLQSFQQFAIHSLDVDQVEVYI